MTGLEYGSRFSVDAFEATLKQNFGAGADADMPEELRFVRGVAALAKRRFRGAAKEAPGNQPVVFVLHAADPPTDSKGRARQRVPMLDNGRTKLGEAVWFVNYAVTEGVGVQLMDDDDDLSLFELLRVEFGLGDLPAAVIEPRDGLFELRYFPDGLNSPQTRELTDLAKSVITPEEVHTALTEIYEKHLVSPSSQTPKTSTWKKASELRPSQDAEARIQSALKVGLGERFTGFKIRQEQPQQSGRLDLEIEEPHEDDLSTVTRHFLLELKVLRAKHEGGSAYANSENLEAIEDGLNQARAYRDERNVREAALCCYDMRATDVGQSAFDQVAEDAKAWGIHTWIWFLFSSDKAWRDATKPASPGGEGGS